MKFFNCHHSFHDLVPVEEYFEEHPEYFSLVNGERLRERTQLCLTNEGVFQAARKTLRRWIKENPDCKVFSVAQNDWENYCTCPKCRELDEAYGTPAASLITFVNRLADDIKEDYPDVLIHTFAYMYTKKAPLGLTVRDNVIVRLCNIECSWELPMEQQAILKPDSQAAGFVENIKQWGKLCKHLYIWDYATNFAHYLLPFPNYRTMPENLKTYHKNHIVGVYGEESFPYIKEYVNMLCDALEGKQLMIYQNTQNAGYITDELVEKADQLFGKALAVVTGEEQRKHLEKEYLSILYMKAARMELEDPQRTILIDRLYEGVKKFGIAEIQERQYLEVSFENLRKSRYALSWDNSYCLYYIMR